MLTCSTPTSKSQFSTRCVSIFRPVCLYLDGEMRRVVARNTPIPAPLHRASREFTLSAGRETGRRGFPSLADPFGIGGHARSRVRPTTQHLFQVGLHPITVPCQTLALQFVVIFADTCRPSAPTQSGGGGDSTPERRASRECRGFIPGGDALSVDLTLYSTQVLGEA